MAGIAYRIGNTLGKLGPGSLTLAAAAVGGMLIAVATPSVTTTAPPAASPAKPSPSARDLCVAKRADMLATYQKEIDAGRPWEAANATRYCAVHLADAELARLTQDAERADTLKTARNPNASTLSRLQAASQLIDANDPEKATLLPLRDQLAATVKREEQKQAKIEAQRRKSEGVSIGMSPDEVIASSWGKPERINQSIRASGTSEQWAYRSGSYLYFENGVLTSVSVRR